MPGKDHIHKVKRLRLGKDGKYIVYACTLKDCTFYMQFKLYIGKETICWGCGRSFILKGFPSDMPEKPRCDNCKRGKEVKPEMEEATEKVIEKVSEKKSVDIDWNSLIPKVPK